MVRSVFLSSIVGGVVAFVWGFISWVIIPWHSADMHRFQDVEAVADVVAQNAPVDGIYMYHPMEMQSSYDGMPFIFTSVNRAHAQEKQTLPLIRGFIIQVVSAFFISWLLIRTKSRKYWDLVTVSAVIGLVAGILTYLPAWNWWGIPTGYAAVGLIDSVITWFLAGLVMAKFLEKVKAPK